MKVVHLKNDKDPGSGDLEQEAKELEQIIRSNPLNDKALNRLMIIYRKLNAPGKELKLINAAIKAYEERIEARRPDYNKKVESISKSLRKVLGLADKKGNNLVEQGDLGKWKRRKSLLLKRKKK